MPIVTITDPRAGGVGTANGFSTTTTGNSAGQLTDVYSHSIVGGTLAKNGDCIQFHAAGTFAATANEDKQIKVVFDGSTIFDTGAIAGLTAANDWTVDVLLIRESATVVKCSVKFISSFADLRASADYTSVTVANLTANRTLKLQLGGTSANDVQARIYKELFLPG